VFIFNDPAVWVETEGGETFSEKGTTMSERPAEQKMNPIKRWQERTGTIMPDEWAAQNDPGYGVDVPRGSSAGGGGARNSS